jgi:hypothetical protein
MDTLLMTIIGIGVLLGFGFFWFIGKIGDIYFKAKLFRTVLKKEMLILNFIDRDGKSLTEKLIELPKAEFEFRGNRYMAEEDRIFRKDRPEDGFILSKKILKWDSGVPVIFVDADTMRPRDFFPPEPGTSPSKMSSWSLAWDANQKAKDLKNKELTKLLLFACVGLLVILLIGVVAIYSEVSSMHQEITAGTTSTTNNNAKGTTDSVILGPTG